MGPSPSETSLPLSGNHFKYNSNATSSFQNQDHVETICYYKNNQCAEKLPQSNDSLSAHSHSTYILQSDSDMYFKSYYQKITEQ